MYHFLQFRPDKKEVWRFFDEKQLGGLEKAPAFMTVLAVDQDPELLAEAGEDPVDHVKYFGPMYWDFDGTELDPVLDDARALITWLREKLDISKEYIHCWLSGQKGVHITVPPEVFGIRTGVKALPWIYREIAAQLDSKTLDRGVYSCGRGRMWRCEGVARPGKGTFKVGVSVGEMEQMNAQQYEVMVASPRPPLLKETPAKSLIFPKAESLMKSCRVTAMKKLRASRAETTMPMEALLALDEVPGCISKLITEGDCSSSNWNQAAMQVASYVAARYTREDSEEYIRDIIQPFITNIESSSRPTEKERLKHVNEQLNRAFGKKIKFSMGPLISTLGQPCGNCPLCRADLATPEGAEGADRLYCPVTKIRAYVGGMARVGEHSLQGLTSFQFIAHTQVSNLEPTDDGYVETQRTGLVGTLKDDSGRVFENFEIDESSWRGRRELMRAVEGRGTSTVTCTDTDVQMLLRAVLSISGPDMTRITKTSMCGVILEKVGAKNLIPHYVEAGGSYTQHDAISRFYYSGEKNISPNLLEEDYPYKGDEELESTLRNLFKINHPSAVAATIGWIVACHFREHIQLETNQFPLLNLSGGAQAGKSSFAFLALNLGGMDYSQVDFVNVEVSTIYPLIRFLTSSTTVPRLVEEVNPGTLKQHDYLRILGIFKASWNRAPIPRGYISNDKQMKVTGDRVSAPIIYTSEQPPSVPSLRSRSIEVRLATKALANKDYVDAYKAANTTRHSLRRMAKALVTKAINTSPKKVMAAYGATDALVPDEIGQRPKFGFQTCLFGLNMLEEACEEYGVDVGADIAVLRSALLEFLTNSTGQMAAEKSITEVDRVLHAMDNMAGEPEDHTSGLRSGTHYWRTGKYLYLILTSIMPRYLRFSRSTGDNVVIRDYMAMGALLQGEAYFDRVEAHPTRPALKVHVIDLDKLGKKGTSLSNFQDGTEPDE